MQVKREQLEPTKVKLEISAGEADLEAAKQTALKHVGKNVKVPGFRAGKAPAHLIEKQIDPAALQTEFIDHAVNDLYLAAIQQEKLRPVAQPQISITKFVPYGTLEFAAETEVLGEIELPDYKKIKIAQPKVEVTADEVNKVMDDLRQRSATKDEVKRAAKDGDEVVINFKGSDAATGEAIDGAEGQDYPLVIGSKNFIPGFEEQLIGLKTGGSKTFEITFPEDYGVPSLQKRHVKFEVGIIKVQALKLPKLDDDFAKTAGPFKSLSELKADVKQQLKAEKNNEARRAYENQIVEAIAAQTKLSIPPALVDSEIDRLEEEEKRDLAYRGQTWQEHLDADGITAQEHRERQRDTAELRVKVGVLLGEIAEQEGVTVTPEELEVRIMLLKNQYPDEAMQTELDKPENRRDIESRMMTEKTLDLLRASVSK